MIKLSKIFILFYSFKKNFVDAIFFLFSFFYARIYFFILICLNLLLWLGAYYINVNVSQDLVVLHYNVDFGVNLIGNVKEIFIIPFLSLVIIFINGALVLFLCRNEYFKFIIHLILCTGIIINLFLLASLASIYLINFR